MNNPDIGQGKEDGSMDNPDTEPRNARFGFRTPARGWKWAAHLLPAVLACTFAGAGWAQPLYEKGLDEAVSELSRTLVNEAKLKNKEVLVKSDDIFEMETGLRLGLSEMLRGSITSEFTRSGVLVSMQGSDEDAVMVLHGRWRRQSDTELYLELFVAKPVKSGDPAALKSAKGRVRIDESIRRAIAATPDDWGRLLVLRLERGVRDGNRRKVHLQPMAIEGDGVQGGRLEQFLTNWLGTALAQSRLFTLVEPPPGVSVETDGKLYVTAAVSAGRVEVSLRVLGNEYQRVTFATVGLDQRLFPPGVIGPDVREAVRAVEEAIGRGEFGEARRRLEDLRRLNASHPRLAGLEEEMVRAERERFRPGKRFRDCPECPELVVVPAGSFMMGSPESEAGRDADEGPVHRVTIGRAFAVGVHEVTRGEFAHFVSATGRSMGESCWTHEGGEWKERSGRHWKSPGFSQADDHPVVCVNWNDAKAYVRWLSGETGAEYRLLSESEWEYVARAGTRTARYWGESESGQCRYANGADASTGFDWRTGCNDGHARTAPVGRFHANRYKLHDVLGNVWEWVEDCWNNSYNGAPADGSAWKSGKCRLRGLRSGSWAFLPLNLRSANRNRDPPGLRFSNAGFRVARTLTP